MFVEYNFSSPDVEDVDCSCAWEFTTPQVFDSNITFFGTGTLNIGANWTLQTSNRIVKQNECMITKPNEVKIIK